MMVQVEISRDNPALARAEVVAATEALGGHEVRSRTSAFEGHVAVDLENRQLARALAERVALAHRALVPVSDVLDSVRQESASRGRAITARFEWLHPGEGDETTRHSLVEQFRAAGGHLDLRNPDLRFRIQVDETGRGFLWEELLAGNRPHLGSRRETQMPFRRPVTLAPRLARAAANLARIHPGDIVVDPFVGTGSLLIECARLGGRVWGIDRDSTMVRGALANFARAGLSPGVMVVDDAERAAGTAGLGSVGAVVTDPPYGRASASGGEPPNELIRRVLRAWASRVRPLGRIVLIVPGGPDPLPPPWRREVAIPQRVHRSLTREFRVYAQDGVKIP